MNKRRRISLSIPARIPRTGVIESWCHQPSSSTSCSSRHNPRHRERFSVVALSHKWQKVRKFPLTTSIFSRNPRNWSEIDWWITTIKGLSSRYQLATVRHQFFGSRPFFWSSLIHLWLLGYNATSNGPAGSKISAARKYAIWFSHNTPAFQRQNVCKPYNYSHHLRLILGRK